MNILLIFLGGGLGAISRFLLSSTIDRLVSDRFPYGILACNLLGCFAIGLALGWAGKAQLSWWSPLVVIGFLGSFTTFSTFSQNTLQLIQEQHFTSATFNIILSLLPGILAVMLGIRLVAR